MNESKAKNMENNNNKKINAYNLTVPKSIPQINSPLPTSNFSYVIDQNKQGEFQWNLKSTQKTYQEVAHLPNLALIPSSTYIVLDLDDKGNYLNELLNFLTTQNYNFIFQKTTRGIHLFFKLPQGFIIDHQVDEQKIFNYKSEMMSVYGYKFEYIIQSKLTTKINDNWRPWYGSVKSFLDVDVLPEIFYPLSKKIWTISNSNENMMSYLAQGYHFIESGSRNQILLSLLGSFKTMKLIANPQFKFQDLTFIMEFINDHLEDPLESKEFNNILKKIDVSTHRKVSTYNPILTKHLKEKNIYLDDIERVDYLFKLLLNQHLKNQIPFDLREKINVLNEQEKSILRETNKQMSLVVHRNVLSLIEVWLQGNWYERQYSQLEVLNLVQLMLKEHFYNRVSEVEKWKFNESLLKINDGLKELENQIKGLDAPQKTISTRKQDTNFFTEILKTIKKHLIKSTNLSGYDVSRFQNSDFCKLNLSRDDFIKIWNDKRDENTKICQWIFNDFNLDFWSIEMKRLVDEIKKDVDKIVESEVN